MAKRKGVKAEVRAIQRDFDKVSAKELSNRMFSTAAYAAHQGQCRAARALYELAKKVGYKTPAYAAGALRKCPVKKGRK